MTAALGSSGAPSRESKALRAIDSGQQTFVNRDFVKNISWLNQSVDTLSIFTQRLQKGVDEANQNVIEQITSFAADLFVLFAGGEPTGIEIGDLKYIIQGIGAMLGINPETPFPMNLVLAATHLLENFIIPLPQFTDVIFDSIVLWAEDLGFTDEAVDSIIEFNDAITDLFHSWEDLFDSLEDLLSGDLFGLSSILNIKAIEDFIEDIKAELQPIIDGPRQAILQALSQLIVMLFKGLTWLVNMLNPNTYMQVLGINYLGENKAPKASGSTSVWAIGTNPSLAWVFDSSILAPSGDGSFTTGGTGLTKRFLSQEIIPCEEGESWSISGQLKWDSIPVAIDTLGPCVVFYSGATEITQTNINIDAGHDATGGWAQVTQVVVVPVGVDGFKIGGRVSAAVNSGTVWLGDLTVLSKSNALDFSTLAKGAFDYFFKGITGFSLNSFPFLSNNSPLDALNLFNIIPQNVLGFIPYSHVGEGNPNLLANPNFEGAVSVQGSGIWFWDEIDGIGSVYTTADGALKQLVSNAIPVSEGQELDLSIHSMWSELSYTGTPLKISVVRLLDYVPVGTDDLIGLPSPVTNQTSWLKIGGEYTVPDGCNLICLQLEVTANASAGTVRFSKGNVHKVGLLKIPWVNGLPTQVSKIQNIINSIFTSQTNVEQENTSFADMIAALRTIPFFNVLGYGGPENIGDTHQSTWDQLISGLVGELGTGAGLADLFNISYDVSSWASKGRMSWDILGIRNNKTIDSGLLATSGSNFGLSRVAMQGSAPTIAVTQGVSAMAFMRMEQSNNKQVISWLGSDNANITACYINIWRMNPNTGDIELMQRSPNIVANLSSTMAWVIYTMPEVLPTQASEVYGIEITVQGSGTHNVAGTTTWIPLHPSSFPKSYAATRNSGTGSPAIGTTIASASVSYATNIPWIEWGITTGVGSESHSPASLSFNTLGTISIPVPSWVNYIDVIALGAGGGGHAGYGLGSGGGGNAGYWAAGTAERGVQFTGDIDLVINVGAGGVGGDNNTAPYSGTDGGNTTVSIPSITLTANGGVKGTPPTSVKKGESPGNYTYNGVPYSGGVEQNTTAGVGSPPGGGGGGGSPYGGPGGAGANGAVWIVFRQS